MTILYSVYCITRNDGLRYIGKAKNIKTRINSHKKSERFKSHDITYEILFQSENHELIEDAEEFYINWFDTYNNGLNKTKNGTGNHNSPNFTTYGKKYSEKSKQKIKDNHWSKKGYKPWNLGKTHSIESKQKMSNLRKGKFWSKKYNEQDVEQFLLLYKTKPNILIANTVQQNGRLLPYDRAFAKTYAKQFKLHEAIALKILKRKTLVWKPILEKILDSKF